jgi:hypothetical protein
MGAVVRMVDQPRVGLGFAAPAGHVQGVDHQLGSEMIGDRLADDPSRPGVGLRGLPDAIEAP